MARIRTIKPEFPLSESMGRISRDARLCFILMWTIADDEGRGRGNPQLLARTLFPYDDDAVEAMPGWLAELEAEGCVTLYRSADDKSYFQITNWADHQKIDKPSPSKFPAPDGSLPPARRERDVEAAFAEAVMQAGELFGSRVFDLTRQARVGSYYIDIMVATEARVYVIEVKRDTLTVADLKQVLRYSAATGACPILLGASISPQFPLDECRAHGVAILLVRENGRVEVGFPSNTVKDCSITLSSVISRSILLGSVRGRTKDQGEDLGRDRGVEGEARAGAPTREALPPPPADPPPPEPTRKKPPAKRMTLLPADWQPDEVDRAYAAKRGYDEAWVVDQAEGFRAHHIAHGKHMSDWHAAWQTWVRNAHRFGGPVNGHAPPARQGVIDYGKIDQDLLARDRARTEETAHHGHD